MKRRDWEFLWLGVVLTVVIAAFAHGIASTDPFASHPCAMRDGGDCVMHLRSDIHPAEVCDGR